MSMFKDKENTKAPNGYLWEALDYARDGEVDEAETLIDEAKEIASQQDRNIDRRCEIIRNVGLERLAWMRDFLEDIDEVCRAYDDGGTVDTVVGEKEITDTDLANVRLKKAKNIAEEVIRKNPTDQEMGYNARFFWKLMDESREPIYKRIFHYRDNKEIYPDIRDDK
ncbi:MAG: hypothetical protein ABEK17_01140, partial [Candidatus Aenigmatarchaeota archaeon]